MRLDKTTLTIMELDWNTYINFSPDIEDDFMPLFTESFKGFKGAEKGESAKSIESPGDRLEDNNIIMPPNDNTFIELEVEPIEFFTNDTNNSECSAYQYNLNVGDTFDDWESVDKFMHGYCLERGFGYQIYRNDKDTNNHAIIRHKSFYCSLSGNYEARKEINQNAHCLQNSNKTNCKWHSNFKLPKTEQQIKCTTLVDIHNHKLNPIQITHLNVKYRQFNDDMINYFPNGIAY